MASWRTPASQVPKSASAARPAADRPGSASSAQPAMTDLLVRRDMNHRPSERRAGALAAAASHATSSGDLATGLEWLLQWRLEKRDARRVIKMPAGKPDGQVQHRERRHQDKAGAKNYRGQRGRCLSAPALARPSRQP